MSYCRFGSGDVYMYSDVAGGITCCACSLASRVKSIFTEGYEEHPLFGSVSMCEECNGNGCDDCMLPGNMSFGTYKEAIDHLYEHKDAGDKVPDYAFDGLITDMNEGEPLDGCFCDCGNVANVVNVQEGTSCCMTCAMDCELDDDETF